MDAKVIMNYKLERIEKEAIMSYFNQSRERAWVYVPANVHMCAQGWDVFLLILILKCTLYFVL